MQALTPHHIALDARDLDRMLPFGSLLPDTIFAAAKAQGYTPTGALLALNSYENRVYEIAVEGKNPLIAKFYRPGRWDAHALGDEHRFIAQLAAAEVPVVPPLGLREPIASQSTLGLIDGRYYAFYPKFKGRDRADLRKDDRVLLGNTLARLHNQAANFDAPHRIELTPETYGYDNLDFILTQPFLPADLKSAIEHILLHALDLLCPFFDDDVEAFPLHGDCHLGNILWNEYGPHLVDFDDMLIAPPIQDLWMLFSGDEEEKKVQREDFFKGYEPFRRFDHQTFILAEPLRTLRMIQHAGWIGKRYDDPAFKRAFPYYTERRYWEELLQGIKEQIALLQELHDT